VLNQAETDWTREIQMHDDIAGQLGAELENISPQIIYMGYYTDPYQPCEAEYQQTRKVLAVLLERGFSASILTKSNMIVRDMDLLQKMAHAHVSVSVAFNDNHIRQLFEANTVDTEVRIGALAKLRQAGIHTGALICPVIPYITDVFTLLELLVPHTDVIWIYGLSIQERSEQSWQNVHNILDEHFPDLKERIESVIFAKDHPYWNELRQQLEKIESDRQLDLRIRV
jgi:DNA repair photolyase